MSFYDNDEFDFIQTLENNFSTIKEEFEKIPGDQFKEWHEHSLYSGNQWSVFGFLFEEQWMNREWCPNTFDILKEIKNITIAGFSNLNPGTKIHPHIGYTTEVLRCHMGIIVPEGDCCLQVKNETKKWEEGKCFVFDDTVEHSAWNNTESNRVVLLIDVLRPEKFPKW